MPIPTGLSRVARWRAPGGPFGGRDALTQVETTARAMCRADGHDPDGTVPDGVPAPDAGAAAPPPAPVPRWRAYEAQARRLVEAQTAMLAGD